MVRWVAALAAMMLLACAGPAPLPTIPGNNVRAIESASQRSLARPFDPTARAQAPTLEDLWNGQATFLLDVHDTGLPMGESDTIIRLDGTWWSYVHGSELSAGTRDLCGAPVPFPGCVIVYKSTDGGRNFVTDQAVACQAVCVMCPCDSIDDQIDQQQYPRVMLADGIWYLAYEYRASIILRTSMDGVAWGPPSRVSDTLIWNKWFQPCARYELIKPHPFVPKGFQCMAGGPPGLFVENGLVYVFAGGGQNPGSMICFVGIATQDARTFKPCVSNPLFTGVAVYGPLEESGAASNPFFDFRYTTSAEVLNVNGLYYMFYEGIRGPRAPLDPGDSQFGLGLARSLKPALDGKWERYPGNPLLIDMPGNIGVGHADVVIHNGVTYLYTSLDGLKRSRLMLAWR